MSSTHPDNELDLVRKYYSGQLSPEEMSALEQRALEDPFLREAMDGYDEHPGAFQVYAERKLQRGMSSRSTFFLAAGLLVILSVAVFFLNKQFNNPVTANATDTDSTRLVEIDIIPTSIDTLIVAEISEQISPSELRKSTDRYRSQSEGTDESSDSEKPEDKIEIDPLDIKIQQDDPEIAPEENNISNAFNNTSAPQTFIEDLLVVDYTQLKRNKKMEYTRYELSGVSAEYESESTKSGTDLVEKRVEIPYVDYLEKTLSYFNQEKYKKALSRFLIIQENYPDDINAAFYGGMCYYNLKQYEKALASFQTITDHPLVAFREESSWYQAKTLIKLKRDKEAIQTLDLIILNGGFYSSDAIQLKKSL